MTNHAATKFLKNIIVGKDFPQVHSHFIKITLDPVARV